MRLLSEGDLKGKEGKVGLGAKKNGVGGSEEDLS